MKLLLENWRKYLEEAAGSSYRVYHGSENAVFPEFKLQTPDKRTTDFGWFGEGLYFDTSMRQAISYAGGSWKADENVEIIENAVKGDRANIIPESGAVRIINKEDKPNAGVYVLDAEVKNPYDWKGPGIPAIVQNPYLNKMPEDIANTVAQKMEYSSWEALVEAMESPTSADKSRWEEFLALTTSNTIKQLGHDGVIMTRSNGGAEIVIFGEDNVRNTLV
tara:strand:- start:42 stop:701 length:660 start_codon:yes stop_codon:yes gene_type:complete